MPVPDLNDIRIFAATAEAATLSAAARELNVPVSTISRSLTRLEKHLGILLTQRSTRGFLITESGRNYLQVCKRALRILKDGHELLNTERSQPSGMIKVACPITMAREVVAPLLGEFISRYPRLRVELEPYASGFDQEPREDVDVFFKLRAPRDSPRRIRPFPGTVRGLFASTAYVQAHGAPKSPEQLTGHRCVGAGGWTLRRGKKISSPRLTFSIVSSDTDINLTLIRSSLGIGMLPLWLAGWPEVLSQLVPILPEWKPEPLIVCALFHGPAQRTPKVQIFLNFLAEYMGTERDPRLKQKWSEGYFTARSLSLQLRTGQERDISRLTR